MDVEKEKKLSFKNTFNLKINSFVCSNKTQLVTQITMVKI